VRYRIFRSEDFREPATAYTLVAKTTEPEFRDDHLVPATTYYYRVAAVTRENLQGGESEQIKVKTLTANHEPPRPVVDLSVIRLATDRLIVSWRKSGDKDTARYYLYRGDRPAFDIKGQKPLAIIEQQPYFLETYTDENLRSGHTYFYRVFAEDWAGNRQGDSTTASATTPNN
jgi:hypothetical protein